MMASKTWTVQRVLSAEPDKCGTVTLFRVHWSGYSVRDATNEPLENLIECPELLMDFERLRKQRFKQAMAKHGQDVGPQTCPPMNVNAIRHMRLPNEYVPTGKETLLKICGEISAEGKKPITLMLVRFRGMSGFFYVRRCAMDYYFPTHMALYLKKVNVKQIASAKKVATAAEKPITEPEASGRM